MDETMKKGMFWTELLPGFNSEILWGSRIEHATDANGEEYVSLVFGNWLFQAYATLSDPKASETTVRILSGTHWGVPIREIVWTVEVDGTCYWSKDGVAATSLKVDEKSVREAFYEISSRLSSLK